MTRPPPVQLGEIYTSNGGLLTWRVDRLLPDNVHVVLVSENEPTRRKTVSGWALAERHFFVRGGSDASGLARQGH